jgi:adenylate cyclase
MQEGMMTLMNASPLEISFRVILVTDQPSTQAFLERCLPSDQIVLQSIGALAPAAESIAIAQPDLVILDADSEQLLALEMCGPLKTDSATALLPVVAVARSGRHRLAAYVAGADEFLNLRNSREDISARILNLLQSADRRRKLAAQQLNVEIRRSEQIREAFRRYVSPKLVDQILANAELRDTLFTQQSVRTRAVVMFADMRGFTSMSERLSADLIVVLLNQYFTLLTDVAFRHDGTVFNMSGDCLMVGFGVPIEQNDGLERAINAASEMLSRFRELAARWQEDYQVETGLGIGINEGEVIAGNVGSAAYMNYTIIGDTVNVASRLTQRARAGEILFSQAVKHTLDLRGYEVEALALPPLTLRGRSAPMDIFCVPTSDRVELRTDRVTH